MSPRSVAYEINAYCVYQSEWLMRPICVAYGAKGVVYETLVCGFCDKCKWCVKRKGTVVPGIM